MTSKIVGLLLMILLISPKTKGQTLTESNLVGTWKVVEVHNLANNMPKEQMAKLEKLKKAFLKSRFVFNSDKKFSFDIAIGGMKMINKHWKINNSNGTVTIQEWKDKDTNKSVLMEIIYKRNDNKVTFLISETFFELDVQRL